MNPELANFSFPNDVHILWSLMIVMYPYITGLVAGAFIVSSLYHVFGREELRPVSRLSMVASLAFLLVATLPLLNHLGHPERAFNIMITPNFSSAMAAFGLIYAIYLVLVSLEIWLIYRREIIITARQSRGLKRWIFAILALGVYDTSEESAELDHRIILVLAAIGIPAACILHGYVGFMFGSVKANVWWSTPLMPIIFLFSAVTSGIAMIIVLYQALMKLSQKPIEGPCVQSLCQWLWLFIIVTVSLELLEIINLAYERNEEWIVIAHLLSSKLAFSFIGGQMVFGALIPILLLGIVVLLRPYLTDPLRNTIAMVASLILLIQVIAMRWNVVIGGQMFSKSLAGFRESYTPGLFEKEGIAVAVVIFIIPFIFMGIFNHFLTLSADAKPEGE
ncbi:MAG TPA: NrfD/PsrC family molybdoenzyme membrane anchor subunit [bacterium]|nr:NrfD/PsrC family molybdoenzyme membrane anchor subunit [bacterium]